ncbi:UTP--glucose-1-phosphate uridylyltransferase [Oceanibium sediminis]|uniref:UTP--glucose-1-phosphate uridylyltransferase n=1 Tax=Oceanibium sediminis TaxID=2026339 RepID=UPI000DD3C3B5|nr:UTP--glucose-1-phosphate uridylyltransferase [Oceanibium sediminis]
MSAPKVRTAVFPVAGLGTRFLPATKSTPKELLPVIDTPLIQFAIDEARNAGVERMIFVSHPSKSAIDRYVLDDADLRRTLRARGKAGLADELYEHAIDEDNHEVVFVMQEEPLGLGHAVLCAKDHVLPGPVAVILPDDLILCPKGCLSEMIEGYASGGAGHLVATMDVPWEDVGSYGILDAVSRKGPFVRARGMVEKPAPDVAPSNHAVVGRYVLDAHIFEALERIEPGAGGELQLTDAIVADMGARGLAGFAFSGIRFDCGSKTGMLAAQLHMAKDDPAFNEVIGDLIESTVPPTVVTAA